MSKSFTKVENDILEYIYSCDLNLSDVRLLLFFIRKMNGFHKDEDHISYSQIQSETGMSKPTISKALRRLQLVNTCLLVSKGSSKASSSCWRINRNVSEWVKLSEVQLVKTGKPVNIGKPVNTGKPVERFQLVNSGKRTGKVQETQLVNTGKHTKESITKETIQKKVLSKESREIKAYGREDINELVSYLEKSIGGSLDDSRQMNRRYCKHVIDRVKKDYPDHDHVKSIKVLIDVGMDSSFHSRNLTSFRYLHKNLRKIINERQSLQMKNVSKFIAV